MKQVVQSVSGGKVRVVDVPPPTIGATQVLVRTTASVLSPGTERAVTALAQSGLLAKARARPDLVRQVIERARTDGVRQVARLVRSRLDQDLALGYSASGVAVEVGEAVAGIAPGQLVATGGGGWASHAEFQAVPGLLCAPVPEGVAAEDAAFGTVASVALHALRLADVGPGAKVAVIGLGLLGQLALRVAQSAGCEVAGIDLRGFNVDRARAAGALAFIEAGDETSDAITQWTRGRGVDAVIVTAAGKSSDPMLRAPAICRDRATIVVVGDVGLHLDRTPLYDREITVRFARSYGPGRYEPSYEKWGVDYPPGYVRWTEGRNIEAVLDLLATKRIEVADLITHRFPVSRAAEAYDVVESEVPSLGLVLTYPSISSVAGRPQPSRVTERAGNARIGLIGAGAFASGFLVPALKAAGFEQFVAVASASSLSARRLAERAGFDRVATPEEVIQAADVDVVVVATPHSSHAELATQALNAGKHVWCEKPIALTLGELEAVEAAWRDSTRVLFVGFNRRFAPSVREARSRLVGRTGPIIVNYRVSGGRLPTDHWYSDRREGGRLIGEACHYVDTCDAIIGASASGVSAMASARNKALAVADDFVITLEYPTSDLAVISYASGGHRSTTKERIEIHGGGSSMVLDNFSSLVADGRAILEGKQDKGHVSAAAAFRRAIAGESSREDPFASSRTTLVAAAETAVASVDPSLQAAAVTRPRPPPELLTN